MMATTVEAILGAVYVDSGANDLDAVRAAVQAMGLHRHPLLVTFTNTLSLLLYEHQMITNMRSHRP
jgi:dsRNA-specific ribonuclease